MVLKDKPGIFVFSIINIILIILYMFDWYFKDNFLHFVTFITGFIIFAITNIIAIYFILCKKYAYIIVVATSSLIFVLPLKEYYVKYFYYINKDDIKNLVKVYKFNNNLFIKKEIRKGFYKYLLKDNEQKNSLKIKAIYGYRDCVMIPVFNYIQMILICSKVPKDFMKRNNYKILKKIEKNVYWIRQ